MLPITSSEVFSIYLTLWFLALGDVIAHLIGYTSRLMRNFTLNLRWSFRFEGNTLSALFKFVLVILTAYLFNLLVVIIVIENFKISNFESQTAGTVPYVLVGSHGCRLVAFIEYWRFVEAGLLPVDEICWKRT